MKLIQEDEEIENGPRDLISSWHLIPYKWELNMCEEVSPRLDPLLIVLIGIFNI